MEEEEDETSEKMIGFLHDPPLSILKQHPNLILLLQHCSRSSKQFSRISSGIQLKKVLDEIIINDNETDQKHFQ